MRSATAHKGIGWDSSHYVSPDFARWMMRAGHRFVMRYVDINERHDATPREGWPVYLSDQELGELLDVGLAVGIVQRFKGSEMLDAVDGAEAAQAMVRNCKALGLPMDVTMWFDAEWGDERCKQADERAYLEAIPPAFFAEGGEDLGIYVGSNTGLTGSQLRGLPGFTSYWKSMSRVPTIRGRGYQLTQPWEYVIRGTRPETWRLEPYVRDGPRANGHKGPRIDLDSSTIDEQGGRWRWIEGDR